jgi:hypothetical protein
MMLGVLGGRLYEKMAIPLGEDRYRDMRNNMRHSANPMGYKAKFHINYETWRNTSLFCVCSRFYWNATSFANSICQVHP